MASSIARSNSSSIHGRYASTWAGFGSPRPSRQHCMTSWVVHGQQSFCSAVPRMSHGRLMVVLLAPKKLLLGRASPLTVEHGLHRSTVVSYRILE